MPDQELYDEFTLICFCRNLNNQGANWDHFYQDPKLQMYILDKFIKIVPIILELSSSFCYLCNKRNRACSVECAFVNPHENLFRNLSIYLSNPYYVLIKYSLGGGLELSLGSSFLLTGVKLASLRQSRNLLFKIA